VSNRHNRPRPGIAERPTPPARDRRVLLIAGGLALLVVLVGLFVALAGDDDAATRAADDAPTTGPVALEGSALPPFEGTDDDPALAGPAPLVEGTTPDGAPISIGATGEPQLLVFLAHWCPHCQAEVPVLVDLLEAGELDDVRTVGILTSTSPDRPNHPPVAWLEREGWTGEILLDDEASSAAQHYGLSSFPYLVVVDAEGQVVARAAGELPAEDVLALVDAAR
jgi:cytochrome c biogenesis protein CcmG, thiol:disulfide interchange protein DsbE